MVGWYRLPESDCSIGSEESRNMRKTFLVMIMALTILGSAAGIYGAQVPRHSPAQQKHHVHHVKHVTKSAKTAPKHKAASRHKTVRKHKTASKHRAVKKHAKGNSKKHATPQQPSSAKTSQSL